MDMTILAKAGQVGWGLVLLTPLVAAAALLVWVAMTRWASRNPRKPESKFKDQDNHRGPEQGGYFRYTPGAFSHSYRRGEAPYNEEER